MPTFTDPEADASEMYEAMRGLAHASRVLNQPERVSEMLDDLRGALRSLETVLEQFATLHTSLRGRATDEAGNRTVGTRDALTAAAELRHAALLIGQAERHLDASMEAAGRIAWQPAAEAREGTGRLINVVFLQGGEADDTLDLIDRGGIDEAILELSGYDVGDETVDAALENGYVYDEAPIGQLDRVATFDAYTLVYNHSHQHVALYRAKDILPRPVLLGIDEPRHAAPASIPARETAAGSQQVRRDRLGTPTINRQHYVNHPSVRGFGR
ncbi:hypothetical protein [Leucobacter japonicus]|uniref:hypothetical protein n=1 Tax=Leucobacter japonicus TaxID=1461259 RepID=UPI0006A7B1D0|nr:hypothetical protein [Leucobacter japonicus]